MVEPIIVDAAIAGSPAVKKEHRRGRDIKM
jgi:hypothetical protein